MGAKDAVTKEYVNDVDIFADIFNYYLHGGKPVISPERLKPLDPTMIALPYGEDGAVVPTQKYRDVAKLLTVMGDGSTAYALLAVEAQSLINYAQPARIMLYDAIQYVAQVTAAEKSHRKAKKGTDSSGEFLSGFHTSDKLLPVITLTVYFGKEKWTGPRTLHDMIKADQELLKFVPDYPLQLIAPSEIREEDFSRFHSELRVALKYIKHSGSGKKLLEAVQRDNAFENVSKRTFDLINVITNSKLVYPAGKEKASMCQAVEDLIQMGKKEMEEQVKEAEGKVKEAEGKVKAAEGKVKAAEGKVKAAEGKVKAAEGKVKAAEGKVEEAEGRVKEAEEKLRAAEARNRELEEKIRQLSL